MTHIEAMVASSLECYETHHGVGLFRGPPSANKGPLILDRSRFLNLSFFFRLRNVLPPEVFIAPF